MSLETRWYFMETTRKSSYGCTLPLLGVLDSNDHVTHFRLNTVPEQVTLTVLLQLALNALFSIGECERPRVEQYSQEELCRADPRLEGRRTN